MKAKKYIFIVIANIILLLFTLTLTLAMRNTQVLYENTDNIIFSLSDSDTNTRKIKKDNSLKNEYDLIEKVIYNFLTEECEYNRAASAAIMANMKAESFYRTKIWKQGCYGICQWKPSRSKLLISFCEKNNLKCESLEGQLQYFKYELINDYPGLHLYLKNIPDTYNGTFAAAIQFGKVYEVIGADEAKSRGVCALDIFERKDLF